MDKTLLRRIPRTFFAKPGRYLALGLLVAISAFCLVCICGSAETLIANSEESAEYYQVEDGEFSCLDPLSNDELAQLTSLGVEVEPSFYLDFAIDNGGTVRFFAMRKNINLVAIDDGGTSPSQGEMVLERNYAKSKGLTIGDTISVAGQTLKIVGLCTSPDYENPLQNLTDPTASFDQFGTAFVTQETYDALHKATASTVSQSYLYTYKLTGGATNDDVVEYISSLKFDALTAQNDFVRSLAYDKTAEKRQIEEEMTQLNEGTAKLKNAVSELQSGLEQLDQGSQAASSASSYASSASGSLQEGTAELSEAANAINQLMGEFGTFQDMLNALDVFDEQIDASLSDYEGTISSLKYAASVLEQYSSDETIKAVRTSLLDIADMLEGNKSELEKARQSSTALREAINEAIETYGSSGGFSDITDRISNRMTTLANGLSQLSSGLDMLDSGVSSLSSNMSLVVSGNSQILSGATELNTRISELEEQSESLTSRVFDTQINKVSLITSHDNNPRIDALAKNQKLFRLIGILLSVALLLLISYVLSVFVSHSIEEERSIIGAMYALGISRRQVLLNYILLPVAVALCGGIVGTLVGISPIGISSQMEQVESCYSSVIASPMPPVWVVFCGLVLPPIIAAIVNVIALFRKLNLPVLDLLNRREASVRTFQVPDFFAMDFNGKFQVRRVFHERGIVLTMFLGTFIVTLLFMLGIDCYSVCNNLIDDAQSETKWEYLYTYAYPESEVPEGGTAVYLQDLVMEDDKNDAHGVMLMGTTADNPYYDVNPTVGKNKCTISSALASKFNLGVGDKIVMTNSVTNTDYAFTVDAVIQYDSALYAFMDISSMRDLFNKDSSYYNVVLSSEPLDINAQALYSTTTYNDVQRAAQQFYDNVRPRMILLMALPVLLFAVVMYLMLMVMIDRAALGISLLKIFGYEEKLVRKLYLRANTFIVIAFALIEIPLCKVIIDAVYKDIMSSASIAGRFDTNPLAFVLAFFIIMVLYNIVNKVLLRRVNKITPSDILRNR